MKDAKGHGSNKRAAWMGKYEDHLVAARPELRGKVDWNTATYHFNSGKSPEDAAAVSASRAAATNSDATAALASGPKSAPAPVHDSMQAASRAFSDKTAVMAAQKSSYNEHGSRHGYNPDAVNSAIASSNRAGRRIGGKEASAIHRLLKGR